MPVGRLRSRLAAGRRAARRLRRSLRALRPRRSDPVDARLGIDAAGYVELDRLDVGDEVRLHGHDYQATTSADFARMVAAIPWPAARATFVDVGTGRGRALFLALEHGFGRAVGVEVSPELVAAARANRAAAAARGVAVDAIELVEGDARSFELPGGPCVVYLFNPFDDVLMGEFAARVARSLADDPRPLVVVYAMPWYPEPWDRVEALHRVVDDPGARPLPGLRRRRVPFTVWST